MEGQNGQVRVVKAAGIHLWILALTALVAGIVLALPVGARGQAMATVQVDTGSSIKADAPGKVAGPGKTAPGRDELVKAEPPLVPGAPTAAAGTQGAETTPATRSAIESMAIRGGTAGTNAQPGSGDKPATDSGLTKGFYSMFQVVAALAVVIGLIYVGRALMRKYVPGAAAGNGQGVIEILARHPLAKGQALVLVRIGSQIVVLNQGRETSQSVLVVSDEGEVANILGQIQGTKPTSSRAGFNRLLANARMDLETGEGAEEGEEITSVAGANKPVEAASMEDELEEMAAARRQLMDLREQVRAVGERIK